MTSTFPAVECFTSTSRRTCPLCQMFLVLLFIAPRVEAVYGQVLRGAVSEAPRDYPILNVHIQEPREAVDAPRWEADHRSKRRQLSELEVNAMSEREFIGNAMASVTAQLSRLFDIARDARRRV